MKIPPVKGTRDFYPAQMAIRNFIVDGWKAASLRNGFAEYDGPIFEYLKMYQVKSGDEIAEQLFSLTDRGGRELAIRPEITPTLARMVNQQINSLPRPVKWFSVPRLCRAERPQKGRLREFFQWNIDIIGVDDVLADAEVIFTTVDYLRNCGLTKEDIKVKISCRHLLAEFLKAAGVPEKQLDVIYPILDKKAKIPQEAFQEMLEQQIPDADAIKKIHDFMAVDDISQVNKIFTPEPKNTAEILGATKNLESLFDYLNKMGLADFCVFDPSIVRGLAYYTGIVFEVHDTGGDLRAIAGGGRYDDLLKQFGGPQVTGTGMGMGDCVLEILLTEKGLLDEKHTAVAMDFFIAYADKEFLQKAIGVTTKLRQAGFDADFSYKAGKLGKQLKQASERNAARCVIIGDEFNDNKLVIKDMATGEQKEIDYDKFFAELKS